MDLRSGIGAGSVGYNETPNLSSGEGKSSGSRRGVMRSSTKVVVEVENWGRGAVMLS